MRNLRHELTLAPGSDFEHGLAEIEARGRGSAFRERKRQIAGAAAQIERAVARLDLREFGNPAFPEPVQAETLEVVDQIVTPGDGCEKVVDLCGALLAGVKEGVAHADSLAHGDGSKSQSRSIRALRRRAGFARVPTSDCLSQMNNSRSKLI